MKRILFVALCALAIPSVFAANPVTVDGTGAGDFLTIQDAITSWASGEINAGETAPFVINVVPGNGNGVGGAYRERMTLDDAVASGEIMGDLVIQSSVPGTYARVELQQDLGGSTAGLAIYQDGESITLRDLMIFPSIVAPTLTGYWIRYDENAGSTGAANTITLDNCLLTQVDTGTGAPLVTSRSEIYTAPMPSAGAGTRQLHFYPDAGEVASLVLTDTCFYGSMDYAVICYLTDPGDSISVTNCCWGYSRVHQLRFSGNATGATAAITGTDQTAGPDNCTVFLQQWEDDNHNIYYLTGANNTGTIDHVIASVVGPDLGGAGSDTRSIAGSVTWDMAYSDCIFYNEGAGYTCVEMSTVSDTFDRVTFVRPNGGSMFFLSGTGAGTMTLRDCIFAGAGATVWGGTAPTGGIDVDYCAYVENGPDAIAARGTIQTDGLNIVTADPVFINSADATSADFMDVDNSQYAGLGTAASNLAGGGDFVGGSIPVELSIFSTN